MADAIRNVLGYRRERKIRFRRMCVRIAVVDGLGLLICLTFFAVLLLCWWQMLDPMKLLGSIVELGVLLLPFWGFWFLASEAIDRLRRIGRLSDRCNGPKAEGILHGQVI